MYNFKLDFELSSTFNCVESYLKLLSSDKNINYTLYSSDKEKSIKDSMKFIIEGHGFSTEKKACEGESKARNALMWYCTKFYSGVKFKEEKMRFTEFALKKMSDESGARILNYKSRNNVYSDDKPTRFLSGSVEMYKSCQVNSFIKIFQQGLNIKLNDKENLGFELYNAYAFESSIRAKFLTLIIAIESLLGRPKRNDKTVGYIESLVKQTKNQTELKKNDMDSLVGCLEELKYQSISSRAKSLIKKYLKSKKYNGKSAEIFFSECYKIRSDIIHTGKPPEKIKDFRKITVELYKMVSALLISSIENKLIINKSMK